MQVQGPFGKLITAANGEARIDATAIFSAAKEERTMSTAEATDLTDVLDRVKTWPTTLRITLARKILESLDKAEAPTEVPPSQTRGFSAPVVQGLLKTSRTAPDDQTVKPLGTIETHTVDQPPRRGSLKGLLGILKTEAPPPTEEECRAILEEELIKKHLK
jgi:hypothetical protein